MTRLVVWGCFVSWAAEVRSAEATELPVGKRPPVSVANGLCHPWALDHGSQAVMMRFFSLAWFASGLAEKLASVNIVIRKSV